MSDIKHASQDILEILKEETKDLWEKEEDEAF